MSYFHFYNAVTDFEYMEMYVLLFAQVFLINT